MKRRVSSVVLSTALLMLLMGCGGGSGGSSGDSDGGSGTISVNVADAPPALPVDGVAHVFVTFDEVSVHKAGGGWIKLDLAQTPYTIDLLQFSNGESTQLVPLARLESGKYTQIRLGVTGGSIAFDYNNDGTIDDTEPLEVPSDNLKTDKNFDFEVRGGGAVHLTVDFVLSRSIVLEGSGTYKLKPALHLVGTDEAATIRGKIDSNTFTLFDSENEWAVVTVIWDRNFEEDGTDVDETYTSVRIKKTSGAASTDFSIFWLVPEKNYIVEVDVDDDGFPDRPEVTVAADKLPPGGVHDLGNPI
jgi:hypothetical protein